MNSKTTYINSLEIATSAVNEFNYNKDIGYLTFVTPIGYISGKFFELKEIDLSSELGIEKELKKQIDEQGKFDIDVFSIANGVYESIKSKDNKYGSCAIVLEDVTISSQTGNYHSNQFVIFTDQIIGVIPAKL
ncbi:hypothetical protein ACTWQB_11360 [Piscibacillus sp. B03]|uniref:hypothetical protein n=1 Tax=Piscibacillus sp. B03 TaxID=3457430 RepID=UPI003FCD67CD